MTSFIMVWVLVGTFHGGVHAQMFQIPPMADQESCERVRGTLVWMNKSSANDMRCVQVKVPAR